MSIVSLSTINDQFVHVYSHRTKKHYTMEATEAHWLLLINKQPKSYIHSCLEPEKRDDFSRIYDLLTVPTRHSRSSIFSFTLLEIKINNLTPKLTRIFSCYDKALSILFSISLLILSILTVLLVIDYGGIPDDYFRLGNLIAGLLIVAVSSIIHELSHVAAATKYRLMVPIIGFKLLYFYPSLFADVTAVNQNYSCKVYRHVLAAGLKANVVLSTIFLSLYLATYNEIFFFGYSLNLSLTLLNLNPFLNLDGYYLLLSLVNKGQDLGFRFKPHGNTGSEIFLTFFTYAALSFRTVLFFLFFDNILTYLSQQYLQSELPSKVAIIEIVLAFYLSLVSFPRKYLSA